MQFLKLCLMVVMLASVSTGSMAQSNQGENKTQRFLNTDKNQDGQISEDEFLRRHKERFSRLDADKDGYLSQNEIAGNRDNNKEKTTNITNDTPSPENMSRKDLAEQVKQKRLQRKKALKERKN